MEAILPKSQPPCATNACQRGGGNSTCGPVPRSVRPSSRVLDGERAEALCRLLVNKLGSRQAGARRLKARSNPRAEVRGAKRWPGSILGQTQIAGTREGNSLSCARSDLPHL